VVVGHAVAPYRWGRGRKGHARNVPVSASLGIGKNINYLDRHIRRSGDRRRLEAWQVNVTDPVWADSDDINDINDRRHS
jgi:hypothetical protein